MPVLSLSVAVCMFLEPLSMSFSPPKHFILIHVVASATGTLTSLCDIV